jgi:mRNA interferase MazF
MDDSSSPSLPRGLTISRPATHAGTKGLVVLDQIRTVEKVRLVKRLGAVSAKTLSAVFAALQEVFAE